MSLKHIRAVSGILLGILMDSEKSILLMVSFVTAPG